jgi:hypothetical protein
LEVINAIKDSSKCCYYSILQEIAQRSMEFVVVRFCHEKRCFNSHAHSLARSSISLEHGHQVWLLNSPDTSIVPLVIG